MHNNYLQTCRVCGLLQPDFPWGETGEDPSHDICACCGTEFGYEDSTVKGIHNKRIFWLQSSAKWWNEKLKPKDWSLGQQLENIPIQYK